ncbi:UvrD-helicase domain-containing protein [Eubacterium coprostanoligenes]|uniref:UvrD-like helicase C-terminal domain-containing protein n=1 Tax=Eubacterium coprostanoligenes TaxID=290054 RepID=A0A1T4JT90_9FIRM|nr:UvrD-helicase domain-containing protein [Eubacterium coprostanoligenes]SJZ33422.1 UvrD-like helicase C-terminal domain-containing protein [Eubacterium coprostanoligenes]
MSSNIVFRSNVFPFEGDLTSDKRFFNQIVDFYKLHSLYNKHHTDNYFNEYQKKINSETPFCALNKFEPCWGIKRKADAYEWVCRCTKTECSNFTKCRASNPLTEGEIERFAPITSYVDDYGYSACKAEYTLFPLATGESFKYEDTYENEKELSLTEKKELPLTEAKDLPLTEEKEISAANKDRFDVLKILRRISKRNVKDDTIETLADEFHDNVITDNPPKDLTYQVNDNIFELFACGTQDEVITGGKKEYTFVDAGPGTGKTYTLIHKINYMVNELEVDPEGIMVLCFTNAAVDVIKKRLYQFVKDGADRGLMNVDVRTFHSFAWWLINQANEMGWANIPLSSLNNYDESLNKASHIISTHSKDVFNWWEHFIVDEVQDLTNTLARFVLKIIHACLNNNCGVTVFGDACQAIYDYQCDNESSMRSIEFYKAVCNQFGNNARYIFFTENHRQTNDLISKTVVLRNAILKDNIADMKNAVLSIMDSIEEVSEKSLYNRFENEGAILLRNNGQTLLLSSDFRKRGVEHTLNLSKKFDKNYAPWIADVFADYSNSLIDYNRFENLLINSNADYSAPIIWKRIQYYYKTESNSFDVRDLLGRIATSKFDDVIFRSISKESKIVSNIHRAKGREYDTVIIDKSFADELYKNDVNKDEYKVFYVAVTRAKRLLKSVKTMRHIKINKIKKEWYGLNNERWGFIKNFELKYLEFLGKEDVNIDQFAFFNNQEMANIKAGDAIRLERKIGQNTFYYNVVAEKTESIIGKIGSDSMFVKDIIRIMKLNPMTLSKAVELPVSVNNLYVSGVYSQIVDSKYLETHPDITSVAPNGVWKWIDIIGLGHMEYDVY